MNDIGPYTTMLIS